jgi:acetolactate synthase-1/2/3 large subunit
MTTAPQAAATSPHPLAGKRMTGAEMIVQVLADEGVEIIFGYSGGAILPTYDAVFRFNDEHRNGASKDPLPLLVPANEQGAGFMAAGYARASGRVGVVLVTSGPAPPTPSRRCATAWRTRSPSSCSAARCPRP